MSIGQFLPDRVRWALLAGLWVIFGIVLVASVLKLEPMPASSELREVGGVIERIDAHSKVVSRGRDPYWFYVTLRGSGQRYIFEDLHAGSFDDYLRVLHNLHRGDRVTLLVQDHQAQGPRIWEIHNGGVKLLSFLTVFDAEWADRLKLFVVIGLYLPLTVVGWRWVRRKWLQSVTN